MSAPMRLNGICPYFTMFPLNFPLGILETDAKPEHWILDPFCGRGTTVFASRMLGLPSMGIDCNPVAVALTWAKLANTSPASIMRAARRILEEVAEPREIPTGAFWELAFHKDVLSVICRLREGLLRNCESDARMALRAIILGALHGPRPKSQPAYFSNQCQRTYAPKPRYAVRYWQEHGLVPDCVDVLEIIERRVIRYYGSEYPRANGKVILGDSRQPKTLSRISHQPIFNWVITSPPYYGMRTYLPDQWLRAWFIGGPAEVMYSSPGQLAHSSQQEFCKELGSVWRNVGAVCIPGAHLVVRFGAINDRRVDSIGLLLESLAGTGWEVLRCEAAGTADGGRRQSLHFAHRPGTALDEHDIWACWTGSRC
jgi:hypothetical protein